MKKVKKKFKTRDELLEIYENVEINQEQLDEEIEGIIAQLESAVKRGEDTIEAYIFLAYTSKRVKYILDVLTNLGYVASYLGEQRFKVSLF